MNESIKSLTEKFNNIKKMGYVQTTRKGSTGIGKTFEDLIGKQEDRSSTPDFQGIEIKTKLIYSVKNTTLFNLTPQGKEEFEIKRIVRMYGYPDITLKTHKVFNATIYGNCLTCIASKYLMGIKVEREKRKVILRIINMNMELVEDYVYWNFDDLENRLNQKLKYLAVINADKRYTHGKAYYYYKTLDFYKLKDFDIFLQLIELGIICVTFHIGVIKTGDHIGEIHDRGTAFQIKECNLTKLFNRISD